MKRSELPKCKCGAAMGLSIHDNGWWCPDCLWSEIKRLREALRQAADMTEHEEDRTLIHNHCVQAAEAGGK